MGDAEEAGASFPEVDAAQAEVIVEQAGVFQAGVGIQHPHAAEAGRFEGDAGGFEEGVEAVHEVPRLELHRLLQGRPDFLEFEEDGTGRGEGQGMADEGAGKKGDAHFGHGIVAVLPRSAIEGIHVFPLAADHAQGHAAANDFAVGDEVGLDAEVSLRPAGAGAETQHHFIEDEGGAGFAGDGAELLDKVDRDHVRTAGHHGFHQHAGDIVAVALQDFEGFGIVVFEDEDTGLREVRNAGRNRDGAQLAVGDEGAGKDFVEDAVIPTGEHGDDVAAGDGAAGADGGHEGFRSGIAEGDAFLAAEPADEVGDFAGQR